ncbi:MAG: antibiotic biosynthesis monooxygenase family protein [Desulfobacterales bacterium]
MAVKILIRRSLPEEADALVQELLRELRMLAMKQEGYISGETLQRVDLPGEVLVISTWESVEAWEKWFGNPIRRELQAKIDRRLGRPTEYAAYRYRSAS